MTLNDRDALLSGEAAAEALRIAERRLEALGWKYSAEDVGACAGTVLKALRARAMEDGRG